MGMTDEQRIKVRQGIKDAVLKITENPEKIIDVAVYGGLAYVSHTIFTPKNTEIPFFNHVINTLYGPIALQLAKTQGGGEGFEITILGTGFKIPINSQAVGLAMLGILGIVPALQNLPRLGSTDEIIAHARTTYSADASWIPNPILGRKHLSGYTVDYVQCPYGDWEQTYLPMEGTEKSDPVIWAYFDHYASMHHTGAK